MGLDDDILNLATAVASVGLTLLVITSWHLRGTPTSRSYLGLLVGCEALFLSDLMGVPAYLEPDLSMRLRALLYSLIAALTLRLACQAVRNPRPLPFRVELFVWGPPTLIYASSLYETGAIWMGLAFLVASFRMAALPIRSWPGYRRALHGVRIALAVPALLPLMWLTGFVPTGFPILANFVLLGLAGSLYLALPRLGLLSSDRVQPGNVIEAMSDGVLIVDMGGRLIDFNQSAREILGLEKTGQLSRPLTEALAEHPDLVELFSGAIDGRSVYTPRTGCIPGEARTYDLQLSALHDSSGVLQSRILVLRDITDRIAIERENHRQSRHVRLVHEVSATVHEAESIEAGLEAALALIARTMGFTVGQFLHSRSGPDGSSLVPSGILFRSEGGSAPALPAAHEPGGGSGWRESGLTSTHAVPVLIGRRLYGVFELFSEREVVVDEVSAEMLEHVGQLVGRAVERKLAEEKIRRLAYRDDLTGLPNRQRFHQLLAGGVSLAERSQRRMALLFMDLDGFKKINDTMGHEVGDRLLSEVASRFARAVRISDHLGRGDEEDEGPHAISRLGGDEFTVLLTEIRRPADAALVAERLLGTLEQPIVLAGKEVFVSISIGISVYPEDGRDSESLLRNADAAMYFAKGRGRNRYEFYSQEMNRTHSSRIEIEARLRGAIEREELTLHYQPILDAVHEEVVAAEALLRWVDGERGSVPPDEFIEIAEETGLIVPLGQWVFREACRQLRAWRMQGLRPIRVGVNVSGHQIREPGMLEMVRNALEEMDVPPSQIELELTESTIMQDDTLTVKTLRRFKQMGIGLALDDFGTGYSSLSYLRRFTIDRVKIDRTFVADLTSNADDAALTSAIIAMAHGLRLQVVAEGVETRDQALFLQQRGCDELQGYLFGRPCLPEEFVDLLRSRPRPQAEPEKDPAEG
ncbi:MAG: sensor domain-containing protein [bacterium]